MTILIASVLSCLGMIGMYALGFYSGYGQGATHARIETKQEFLEKALETEQFDIIASTMN